MVNEDLLATSRKRCVSCGVVKSVSAFGPHKATKDRLQCYCRPCAARKARESRKRNIERHHEVQKAWRDKNKEKRQLYDLRQIAMRYGMGKSEFFAMLASQQGLCRICTRAEVISGRRLSVDHDHVSRRVRGLLCSNCNLGIGYFFDNPTLLRRAADYLEHSTDVV